MQKKEMESNNARWNQILMQGVDEDEEDEDGKMEDPTDF